MNYIIDAWLDTSDPTLRLINCDSGKVERQWQGPRLRDWLELGELVTDDFLSNDTCDLKPLLQELLLLDCRDQMTSRHGSGGMTPTR